MSEQEEVKQVEINNKDVHTGNDDEITISYIMRHMDKIISEKDYLKEAINALNTMEDGTTGDTGYAPENVAGQAKANALADIVKSRETTNQQLLKFYEKVYDDLKGKKPQDDKFASKIDKLVESTNKVKWDGLPDEIIEGFQDGIASLLCSLAK